MYHGKGKQMTFWNIDNPKVSMKHLRLPIIDKLFAEGLPQVQYLVDIMICLSLDVKGGSIANLRAIKSKILEKNLLHRIDNGPSIRLFLTSTILRFTASYVLLFWEAYWLSLCRQGDKYVIIQLKHSQENVRNIENVLNENLKLFHNAKCFVEKKYANRLCKSILLKLNKN